MSGCAFNSNVFPEPRSSYGRSTHGTPSAPSTEFPSATWRWRCGAVVWPESPSFAIVCPPRTRSPGSPANHMPSGSGGESTAASRLVRVRKKVARHHVYVIELDPAVRNHAKFRAANPGHDPRKPPLYVGMTGLDPATRFERHKYGVKDNHYVRRCGRSRSEEGRDGEDERRSPDVSPQER